MESVIRLLVRFILVPLGYLVAVLAGTCVILFGSWKAGSLMLSDNPDAATAGLFGVFVAGPILFIVLLSAMWLPGAIGILISEAFAIAHGSFTRSTAQSRHGSAGKCSVRSTGPICR